MPAQGPGRASGHIGMGMRLRVAPAQADPPSRPKKPRFSREFGQSPEALHWRYVGATPALAWTYNLEDTKQTPEGTGKSSRLPLRLLLVLLLA